MLDREIINALLDIKAVELRVDKENWFTWASVMPFSLRISYNFFQ